ncbi:unnamed protein product [Rotaria sordida]|uniref:DUF72 domain-containing protein n=1 Tax=Rotaria sordida TaxID=392033 RepID=A0A814PJ30_9BILA|nr:unnamed protein product [Rotaria sordida]CAF3760795.1 unnamed protein product [Rotaria sordida]
MIFFHSIQSRLGRQVHIVHEAWKMMTSCNNSSKLIKRKSSTSPKPRKRNSSKTTTQIERKNEQDLRPRLFSLNSLIRCGTSGYSYKSWHMGPTYQNYYPDKNEFDYYCGEFDTVEINSTFYHIPLDSAFKTWANKVPRSSFLYTIKANKFFTHMKKLNIDEIWIDRWEQFWNKCLLLQSHLGPILFQFPPGFKKTPMTISRFHDLAKVLSQHGKFAFEFRDSSWFCNEIYQIMKKYNWCLCVIDCENSKKWCGDLPKGTIPSNINDHKTCDWGVYYRFHGPKGQYRGVYGEKRMREIAENTTKYFLNNTNDNSIQLFFYFNNTDSDSPPAAIQDCRYLVQAFKDLKIMID